MFSSKYQREVVSTTIYTLSQVQVKKGTSSTPFELWDGYSPNVKYLRFLEEKCYILKDNRNHKLDAKSEEGIFLGYSTRSKAYKWLNTNTKKVMESANIKFYEYIEVHEDEPMKEPKIYRTFSCIQDPRFTQEISCNKKLMYILILRSVYMK